MFLVHLDVHQLTLIASLTEPFNVLPLRQYSDGVQDGVDFIASAYSDIDKACDDTDDNWHNGIL